MVGAWTSFLGGRRVVKDAAGDLYKKDCKGHMATASNTPMKSKILLNCPKHGSTVTGLELANRCDFMIISMHLFNFAVSATIFPIEQKERMCRS